MYTANQIQLEQILNDKANIHYTTLHTNVLLITNQVTLVIIVVNACCDNRCFYMMHCYEINVSCWLQKKKKKYSIFWVFAYFSEGSTVYEVLYLHEGGM